MGVFLKIIKKTKIDIFLVGTGMIIGFLVVVGKITDIWPCDLLEMVNLTFRGIC